MPFDPTFPPHGVGLVSADWRAQFNALKSFLDLQAAQISDLQGANDGLQDQVSALQTELALVPPGVAEIIDVYSSTTGELHLEIASTRATGMIFYRKGPSDADFVVTPVASLVWDEAGLESGTHTIKAAGTNSGGTGPISAAMDVIVS